jgi:hypothetical protein
VGNSKSEAAGALVCVVVRYVPKFDETHVGVAPVPLYQGYDHNTFTAAPLPRYPDETSASSTSSTVPLVLGSTGATEFDSKI